MLSRYNDRVRQARVLGIKMRDRTSEFDTRRKFELAMSELSDQITAVSKIAQCRAKAGPKTYSPPSGDKETAMSDDKRPSDQEIESLLRMARESSDFYEGLAKSLGPQESQAPSSKSPAAESVEQK